MVQSLLVSYISEISKSDKMMKDVVSSWQSKVTDSGKEKREQGNNAARGVAKVMLQRINSLKAPDMPVLEPSADAKEKVIEESVAPLIAEVGEE